MNRLQRAAHRRQQIEQLLAQGATDEQLVKATGLSIGRVTVIRRELGVLRPNAKAGPPELIAEIKRRAAEGWPIGEITATLGCSKHQVYYNAGDLLGSSGRDWNKVFQWARRKHPQLFYELTGTLPIGKDVIHLSTGGNNDTAGDPRSAE